MNWPRVFGASETIPAWSIVEERLADAGFFVTVTLSSDEAGWYRAELSTEGSSITAVERWHVDETGIRAELNSWAAFVETQGNTEVHVALMERLIQARQLFTIEASPIARTVGLCLAQLTSGTFQVDGEGFFTENGTLLIAAP